jgi:hypothetical protein
VAAVVFGALAIVMQDGFGLFVGSEAATQPLGLATMNITLGGNNPEDDQFVIAASNLLPSEWIMRSVTLTPEGDVAPTAVKLTTSAPTSTLLDTDTDVGLYLTVYACTTPFNYGSVGGNPVITGCDGDVTEAMGIQPVIINDAVLDGIDLTLGVPTYLAIVLALPAEADNSFQSLHSVIRFTFAGVAPAGSAK